MPLANQISADLDIPWQKENEAANSCKNGSVNGVQVDGFIVFSTYIKIARTHFLLKEATAVFNYKHRSRSDQLKEKGTCACSRQIRCFFSEREVHFIKFS